MMSRNVPIKDIYYSFNTDILDTQKANNKKTLRECWYLHIAACILFRQSQLSKNVKGLKGDWWEWKLPIVQWQLCDTQQRLREVVAGWHITGWLSFPLYVFSIAYNKQVLALALKEILFIFKFNRIVIRKEGVIFT